MDERIFDNQSWAEQQWGKSELGDPRRQRRAVAVGAALSSRPGDSIPTQLDNWGDIKASYRLLSSTQVTHRALSEVHWQSTRAAAESVQGVVLFIQDGSSLDFTSRPHAQALGPIGDGNGRGLMLHTCIALALSKEAGAKGEVLGVAHQQVLCRGEVRGEESRRERQERRTEAAVWGETVTAIGAPSDDAPLWVSVGDRGSDVFEYLRTVRGQGWHCLLRACQDRRVEVEAIDGQPEQRRWKEWIRSLPARTQTSVHLRGRDGMPKREVELHIAWAPLRVESPCHGPESGASSVAGWGLRCWEEVSPDSESEGLEWLLLSTVPILTAPQAVEQVGWYAHRWLIEEYHKCLKSGCRMEQSQLEHASRLQALLGFLAIIAVRLLQLREISRADPDQAAHTVIELPLITLICRKLRIPDAGQNAQTLTIRQFWHGVARLGGFIGRRSDGEPGWQTLWKGWLRLLDMAWACAT